MIDTWTLLLRIFPIILLIALGMVLRQTRFVSQNTIDDLKKIVLNISLPSMMLVAFAKTEFSSRYIGIIATVFLTCLLMLLAAVFILRRLHVENPFAPALYAGFETGMIGYALFVATFGQAEMYKLAIVDIGQVLFVFFVLVYFLNLKSGIASQGRQLVLSFIRTPIILAIIAGIALSLSGLMVTLSASAYTSFIFDFLALLSNLTVPLITIAIGFELHINRATFRAPLIVALTRIIILLGLAYLINKVLVVGLLGLDRMFEIAVYTLFVLPPPFLIPIIMRETKPDQRRFVLNTISIHILLTVIAYTSVLIILKP